mmetsp:Transcript_55399/g.168380  ORF Transcript_55399/g.168380 Transcript_55399/m.168380 type:complete len:709 (+) Transcript_55399:278-2404(+)
MPRAAFRCRCALAHRGKRARARLPRPHARSEKTKDTCHSRRHADIRRGVCRALVAAAPNAELERQRADGGGGRERRQERHRRATRGSRGRLLRAAPEGAVERVPGRLPPLRDVWDAVEGPVDRPQGVANIDAVHPPPGVLPRARAGRRLVVRDRVAPELGEQRPCELPPLGDLLLGELVAALRQLLRRFVAAQAFGGREAGGHDVLALVLDGLGLGADFRVDQLEIGVRVLIDHVEGPPGDARAELRHVALVAVEVLRGPAGRGAEEGQVGGAVRRVVAQPGHALDARLRLQHVAPRGAVHGDRALPDAQRAGRRRGAPVGVAERPGRHAGGEVVRRALVVVAQHVHDHAGGDGPRGRGHRAGVGVRRLREVPLVGVQLGPLGGAQQAENPPHATAAVEGQDVLEQLARRGIGRILHVGREAVGAEEVKHARGIVVGAPPAHLLRQLGDARAVAVVIRVVQLHLPDGEGVAHRRHVAGGHAHRGPDGAGVVLAGHHVEDPQLLRVGDGERLRAVGVIRLRRVAAVGAVEALLHGNRAHGVDGATRRGAPLQRDLGQVLDAGAVVAVRLVRRRRPADGLRGASALADRQADLVLHAVVHVPIRVRLLDLRDLADRYRLLLPPRWRVLWRKLSGHNARITIGPVEQLPRAAFWPGLVRHPDPPNVSGVGTTVVGVAHDRVPRGARILAHRHDGAGQRARHQAAANSGNDR